MWPDGILLLFALLQTPSGTSFWPITISGWITLAIAVVGIIGGFVSAGKFIGTLNGFGLRLTDLERGHEKAEGERLTMQRQVDRILDQHETILERLGEAKRSADRCGEDTVELGIKIGSKIDTIGKEVTLMNLHLSQRIKAVETILKIKGE